MTSIQFKPWRPIHAERRPTAIAAFLQDAASSTRNTLREGMQGPHSGRTYNRGGRLHQASAPNEVPAIDRGALRASVRSLITETSEETGTNTPYAGYLKSGTRKMGARRMSDWAHRVAMVGVRLRQKTFAGFRVGA